MHDALTIEMAGKPAACICTEPFTPTVKAIAQIRGISDYPFAVITHPVQTLEADMVIARAKQALPQVLQILIGKQPTLG